MTVPAKFIYIDTAEALDGMFAKSCEHPIALLKHSNSCGISAHQMYLLGEIDDDIHVIVVQEHRDLSNEVVARLGHSHQSPQAFVIKDGVAIYHATHYGIDPKAIARYMASQITAEVPTADR